MTEKVTKLKGIREAFLSEKNSFKKKTIDWNDYKIELRELNAKQRGNVYMAATVQKTDRTRPNEVIQEIDNGKLNVWAVIYQAFDADTGARIFQESDFESLASLPCSVLDTLAKPALELLGEDAEETEKN